MFPDHKTITVSAPATIANLVCGFDILGLAIDAPQDSMTVTLTHSGITLSASDAYPLPTVPEENVAGAALIALIEAYHTLDSSVRIQPDIGFDVFIDKKIKPGSGLGSSAASSAGAVVAANHLLGNIFSKQDLVGFAMCGEKVASGVKHADNVAPCIYGGVTLVRSAFPLDIIPIPAPPMFVTVVHPQIEVKTSDARQILRKEVQLRTAIRQWGNIAGLIAGFFKGDYELIGRSLSDEIIEPVRSILIPGFDEVKIGSREAGALGGGISGSGPSIFMLSQQQQTAMDIASVMSDIYTKIGIAFKTYVTTLNNNGVCIVPEVQSK